MRVSQQGVQTLRRHWGFVPNLLYSVSWITFSKNVIPITFFPFPVQVKSDSSVTRPSPHPRRGGPSGLDPLPQPVEAGGDRGFVDARIRQPDIGPVLARLRCSEVLTGAEGHPCGMQRLGGEVRQARDPL